MKEETLAKKIRELRKQRNKERGRNKRAADGPKVKRRRRNSVTMEYQLPPREEEMIRIEGKRKTGGDENPPKKQENETAKD